MTVYTIEDIRGLHPCYDPTRYLPNDWTGTLDDILAVDDCLAEDRLWVVIGLLDDRQRRLLACQLVRRTPLADGRTVWDLLTDERSRNAVEVAERFAVGEATREELDAAWDAASVAAMDTPSGAARDAAWAASNATEWNAASAAEWAAAKAASSAASWAAAKSAAKDATRDAARAAQIKIIRKFVSAI